MCVCIATAVREDGTSVSVPVKMTHLWAGSCLLRTCTCIYMCVVVLHICSEQGLHKICVYYSMLYMYAIRLLLLYTDRGYTSVL